MWRFNLPGVYIGTAFVSLGMLHLSMQLLCTTEKTPLVEICHRKAVMDSVTVGTLISCLAFVTFNMAGMLTSFETERVLWAATFYNLPVVRLLGAVTQPKPRTD